MKKRIFTKVCLAIASASAIPSQALACRHGGDWHLFEQAPAPRGLPGAQIIQVHFSNRGPPADKWPKLSSENETSLAYTLIGVARLAGEDGAPGETFPVYAMVTSCSPFFGAIFGRTEPVIEGEYYLVGRFVGDGSARRFHAGGNWNGRWHL